MVTLKVVILDPGDEQRYAELIQDILQQNHIPVQIAIIPKGHPEHKLRSRTNYYEEPIDG